MRRESVVGHALLPLAKDLLRADVVHFEEPIVARRVDAVGVQGEAEGEDVGQVGLLHDGRRRGLRRNGQVPDAPHRYAHVVAT